jgi:hypothetical protein
MGSPVPLDPDLLDLAQGKPSNIVQQIYQQQAQRSSRRQPFVGLEEELMAGRDTEMDNVAGGVTPAPTGDKPEEDCNDARDQEGELESPAIPPGVPSAHPRMDQFLEPDPATGLVTAPLPAPLFNGPQDFPNASAPPEPALGGRDAAAGWGGIGGGINPQEVPQVGDALPSGMSINDICRAGEQFWKPQWGGE